MNTEYKCVTTVDGIKEYIGSSPLVAFEFETAPESISTKQTFFHF